MFREKIDSVPEVCLVRFLSQNRPGPRMGMGHYERLLIRHLLDSPANGTKWKFDIRFSGRSPQGGLSADSLEPGLAGASFEGFSPERLAAIPWPAARAAMTISQRQSPPDLFHSLSLGYPAPSNRPSIYTIHDLPPARFNDEGILPTWAKQAAASANAVVTPSEFAKRELIELLDLPEDHVHVVPNGYERGVFHPEVPRASEGLLKSHGIDGPFLLYVGGFTRRKNVQALLEAWIQIESHYPDITVALAGPAEELQKLVEGLQLKRVRVLGYLDRDLLPGFLKAAVGLLYPSIYEGFGLPPLEAMALGVPVVAVNAGAIPEVTGNCAILAENGSPDSLASAIITLLDHVDIRERLQREGPAQALRFSWIEHALQVLQIYKQCTNR